MALEEISKLLDTTATALMPEDLEPILLEEIHRLAPVWDFFSSKKAGARDHEFNRRTGLPTAYFEGERADTPSSQSTYARSMVTLKAIRIKGGITNLAQLSMANFIDAYNAELTGSLKSLNWALEAETLWGNADADQYQFTGFDSQIDTNLFDNASAAISLTLLDNMIDSCDENGAQAHSRAFVMSTSMRSSFTRLMREVRHQVELVDINGRGLQVPTYRGIPLLQSSAVKPAATMSALTVAAAAGGALAGNVTHRIAPITEQGEQKASAAVVTAMGGNGTCNLTWTAYPGAILYKIYRGPDDAGIGLVATINARTYDGNGTVNGVRTAYTDAGAVAPVVKRKPLLGNDQAIFLLDRDPDEAAEVRFLSERESPINFFELPMTKDQREFFMRAFVALVMKFEKVHAYARRVIPAV